MPPSYVSVLFSSFRIAPSPFRQSFRAASTLSASSDGPVSSTPTESTEALRLKAIRLYKEVSHLIGLYAAKKSILMSYSCIVWVAISETYPAQDKLWLIDLSPDPAYGFNKRLRRAYESM